jgi:hypothetical protein
VHRQTRIQIILVAAILVPACGGTPELTADSSCRDYVQAAPEEQAGAVLRLAQELQAPRLATPLGRPSVDFACASDADRTLGSVFSQYAGGNAPASVADDPASDADGAASETEQALESLRNDQRSGFVPEAESSGFQIDGSADAPMTLRDAIVTRVRVWLENYQALPEGVSLETFESLLPKALITATDQPGCSHSKRFCAETRIAKPDEEVENVNWVVTFLPSGVSRQSYFRARTR